MLGLRREDVEEFNKTQMSDPPLKLTVARCLLAPAPDDLPPPPEFTIANATLTCVESQGPPVEVVAVVVAVVVVEVSVVVAVRVRLQ